MASRASSSRPSSSSETTHSSRKRRRTNTTYQSRTSFVLAYPAPVYADKTLLLKHLRPRLYLQLQRLSEDGRHYQSAIDVLSLAPPKDPRRLVTSALKKCVGKIKSHGNCLRFDKRDILLARTSCGDPDADADPDPDPDPDSPPGRRGIERVLSRFEDLTEREVIAVLRANNKIVTQDGRTWTASRRSHGSFEFACAGERGGEPRCVARWVSARAPPARGMSTGSRGQATRTPGRASSSSSPPPSPSSPRRSAAEQQKTPGRGGEAAFNFSLIDPGSRRHAVLATLSPSSLDVKDTYQQPASPLSDSGSGSPERAGVHVVDQDTRTLILATAVWLDLYLGWSPSY